MKTGSRAWAWRCEPVTRHGGDDVRLRSEDGMERWKPILGFPGYEVSDLGRVRSFRRRGAAAERVAQAPALKAPTRDKDGYLKVRLYRDGDVRSAFVHRLVLESFVGPCPDGMEARHVASSDPADCRLSNLAWGTHAENIGDRRRHGSNTWKREPGSYRVGEGCAQSRLSDADVLEIRRSSLPSRLLAERFGVSSSAVRKARSGKNWKHVGRPS